MRLTVFKVTWHVLSESDSSYSGAGTIRNLGWIEKEEAGIATIELPPQMQRMTRRLPKLKKAIAPKGWPFSNLNKPGISSEGRCAKPRSEVRCSSPFRPQISPCGLSCRNPPAHARAE